MLEMIFYFNSSEILIYFTNCLLKGPERTREDMESLNQKGCISKKRCTLTYVPENKTNIFSRS